MIKVSIFYPSRKDGKFDMGYYFDKHMPMAIEKFGCALKGVTVDQGLSGGLPGSDPVYVAMAHFLFDSTEAFYAAFLPHFAALQGDVPNYTNIEPVIQISNVGISR